VLTIRRRCGESVIVGENIEISVLEIAGGRVKLGIAAPREVIVLRSELKLTEDFNREAARISKTGRMAALASALSSKRTLDRCQPSNGWCPTKISDREL
jgi:carbon storage regulator